MQDNTADFVGFKSRHLLCILIVNAKGIKTIDFRHTSFVILHDFSKISTMFLTLYSANITK